MADAGASSDLVRAKTKVPRREFCGGTFEKMGQVLNGHLVQNYGSRVKACSDLTLQELRELQGRLFEAAEQELLAIYANVTDNRRERHSSMQSMKEHWEKLVAVTPDRAVPMLRDGLCHEIVMRFVHHTTENVKKHLLRDDSFFLPSLPTDHHFHDGHTETLQAHQEYVAATGCQACHSRLVPLPSPDTPQECGAQLKAACGKRGVLMKEHCMACVAGAQDKLGQCKKAETDAWCNHPAACIGAATCPVWPTLFGAPFSLHSTVPPISTAKSYFYYKYDSEIQAQTVDYIEKCFPFVNAPSIFDNKPCKLFFNPKGIYLSQPGRVDCCLFVPGVGAVPPEFLQSFTLVGTDKEAPDMYGNQVKCDEWSGPQGFKYWTASKDDAIYGNNTGHDIVFQDGPTGVTWRWGNFEPLPAGDHFSLPSGQCEEACPKFLEADEMTALSQDPHVKRSVLHHARMGGQAIFI